MKPLSGPEYLPQGKVKNVVILLHGLGSNGEDLLGLVPMLSPLLPQTAFLAPHAPLPTPFAAQGFQWFAYWDRTPLQMMADIKIATPLIVNFIHDTCTRFDITPQQIILCGFSQGTMMSLYTGLRFIDGLGGIIGFSGLLMSPETLPLEKVKNLPPVLLVHGLQDTVVPAAGSLQAEIILKSLGCDVTYVQRPSLGHSIDEQGIKAAVEFCQHVFGV